MFSVIPGFRLSLGITLTYLGLIVLLPIAALLLKAGDVGFARYIAIMTSPRTLASFQVTITTAAAIAATMLGLAFLLLVSVNLIQAWHQRRAIRED